MKKFALIGLALVSLLLLGCMQQAQLPSASTPEPAKLISPEGVTTIPQAPPVPEPHPSYAMYELTPQEGRFVRNTSTEFVLNLRKSPGGAEPDFEYFGLNVTYLNGTLITYRTMVNAPNGGHLSLTINNSADKGEGYFILVEFKQFGRDDINYPHRYHIIDD
ncbi:hypothetical protein H0O03_03120 [Candidatus Micrarchaeota archaeon]|nr:hypothetical protein [Candidatus Micrarchaeota archaeon]